MACDALHTGQQFLSTTLAHIDCQARTVGAYGFSALADPGSSISIALIGLLTVFIALFGIRLLMGYPLAGRDVIGDALRVGIVLTLASSWPAWRTVGYDLVLNAPAEVAGAIAMASGLPGGRGDMRSRLQDADDGVVAITVFGSGRLAGDVAKGADIGDSPRGIAVSDQFALGLGRTLFLATTIGSVALVRLGAGVLLAIAPLMAGLLLFGATASLFFGWLRALIFCALSNAILLVVQGTELALLYPWINDVLEQRGGHVFTPSAPTELLVLALGYGALTVGLLFLTARLTFLPTGVRLVIPEASRREERPASSQRLLLNQGGLGEEGAPSRALMVSEAVSHMIRREEQAAPAGRLVVATNLSRKTQEAPAAPGTGHVANVSDTLGSSFRRSHRRTSAASQRREQIQ